MGLGCHLIINIYNVKLNSSDREGVQSVSRVEPALEATDICTLGADHQSDKNHKPWR